MLTVRLVSPHTRPEVASLAMERRLLTSWGGAGERGRRPNMGGKETKNVKDKQRSMSHYQSFRSNHRSIHSKTMQVILGLCFLHIIMEEETEKQRLLKTCKRRQTRASHFTPGWQSSPVTSRPDGHRPILSPEAWDSQLITEAAERQSQGMPRKETGFQGRWSCRTRHFRGRI